MCYDRSISYKTLNLCNILIPFWCAFQTISTSQHLFRLHLRTVSLKCPAFDTALHTISRPPRLPRNLGVQNGVHFLCTLDDGWWLRNTSTEDVPFDEIRQPLSKLIGDKFLRRDREDLCVARSDYQRNSCFGINLRSISSSVSCFVSRTKQKIMNQAIRFSTA